MSSSASENSCCAARFRYRILDGAVLEIEQILAQIPQGMEMADKIGDVGEQLFDGLPDGVAHVMDATDGRAIIRFHLLQQGDNSLAVLRRHLPVAQHDIAQCVNAAEQMRAVAFTGAVHVQDIAAAYLHIVFERFMALAVGQHQVNNKAFAQETDLILRDGDIPGRQLGADLWVMPADELETTASSVFLSVPYFEKAA